MKKIVKWIGGIILFLFILGWIAQWSGYEEIEKVNSTKNNATKDPDNSSIKSTEVIYKSEFIGEWPFTKDTVKIFCENNAIWLVSYPSGQIYTLNGFSKSYLENKNPNTKINNLTKIHLKYKDISYFLDLAKKLCL